MAFRPAFINRLDEIILFHRLFREHMDGIVDIQLARLYLEGRVKEGDRVKISATDEGLAFNGAVAQAA